MSVSPPESPARPPDASADEGLADEAPAVFEPVVTSSASADVPAVDRPDEPVSSTEADDGPVLDADQVDVTATYPEIPLDREGAPETKKAKKKKKKDKKKNEEQAMNPLEEIGTKRGIETLFRSSYRVHMDLTSLADAKANIMISINGLIVGIVLGGTATRIDANPYLLYPTVMLLVGCLVSLTFAVLAARPRVYKEPFSLDDARSGEMNLLYFGNFTQITRDDFEAGMRDLVVSGERIYVDMMRDLYGIGSVLDKKFKMLRISYGAFLIALIVGGAMFIAAFFGVAAIAEAADAPDVIQAPTGILPIIPQ